MEERRKKVPYYAAWVSMVASLLAIGFGLGSYRVLSFVVDSRGPVLEKLRTDLDRSIIRLEGHCENQREIEKRIDRCCVGK